MKTWILRHLKEKILIYFIEFFLSSKHFEKVRWKTPINEAIGWSIWSAVTNYKWKRKQIFSCYAALLINGKYIFCKAFILRKKVNGYNSFLNTCHIIYSDEQMYFVVSIIIWWNTLKLVQGGPFSSKMHTVHLAVNKIWMCSIEWSLFLLKKIKGTNYLQTRYLAQTDKLQNEKFSVYDNYVLCFVFRDW